MRAAGVGRQVVSSVRSGWLRRRLPDTLGGKWQFPDDGPGGVGDGARDGGSHTEETTLSSALGAVRARPVPVLDEQRVHFQRHIFRGRYAVVQRTAVQYAPALIADQLLHQSMLESHDRRAFILGVRLGRIQSLPA